MNFKESWDKVQGIHGKPPQGLTRVLRFGQAVWKFATVKDEQLPLALEELDHVESLKEFDDAANVGDYSDLLDSTDTDIEGFRDYLNEFVKIDPIILPEVMEELANAQMEIVIKQRIDTEDITGLLQL